MKTILTLVLFGLIIASAAKLTTAVTKQIASVQAIHTQAQERILSSIE